MDAALLAEAAGLCTIIRGDAIDTIYIHPVALEQLCDAPAVLSRAAGSLPFVKSLAQKLQALLASPGQPPCGKLYEEIVTLAFVCRIATTTFHDNMEAAGQTLKACEEKCRSTLMGTVGLIDVGTSL